MTYYYLVNIGTIKVYATVRSYNKLKWKNGRDNRKAICKLVLTRSNLLAYLRHVNRQAWIVGFKVFFISLCVLSEKIVKHFFGILYIPDILKH